jgi:hypothetical protein
MNEALQIVIIEINAPMIEITCPDGRSTVMDEPNLAKVGDVLIS